MRNFSCFDILGPVMVGPSSSHTAGRLGWEDWPEQLPGIAQRSENPIARVFFPNLSGSRYRLGFNRGLLGFETDDVRIRDSFEIAKQQGLIFQLVPTNLGEGFHPNSVKFLITTVDGEKLSITGASVGGGNVVITHINDDEIELKGDLPALITTHRDIPGVISQVCGILAGHNINIAFMRVFRKEKRKLAHMVVETDEKVEPDVLEEILKIETVENVRAIEPV